MSDPTTISVSQPEHGQEVEVRFTGMDAFQPAAYDEERRLWLLAPGWAVSTTMFDEWRTP